MNMRTACKSKGKQRGTSLIEMMIAILVLTVDLIGTIALASVALNSDTRSKRDSTSSAMAEMVAGQISAIPVGGSLNSVTVTDCAGNSLTVNTSGTTAGAGATLTTSGTVDFTQSFSSVTAGYSMKYTVCGVSNGLQTVYDVRWNVKTLPSGKAEYVVVGAQFSGSNSKVAQLTALPVNVRTVVGNDGN
jgi:Tfp pilus assembly protein PilV